MMIVEPGENAGFHTKLLPAMGRPVHRIISHLERARHRIAAHRAGVAQFMLLLPWTQRIWPGGPSVK
jgi:hypothetical protein